MTIHWTKSYMASGLFLKILYCIMCSHPAWLQVTKAIGGKTLNEEDYCTKNPGLSAMGPSATRQENHSIILWMTVEAIERANWFQLSQYPCCCRSSLWAREHESGHRCPQKFLQGAGQLILAWHLLFPIHSAGNLTWVSGTDTNTKEK